MKKIFALLLVLCMAVALFVGCAPAEESGKLKLGVILIGDENEGYTYAHIKGIRDAIDALGKDKVDVIWKFDVDDKTDEAYPAAVDLVEQGCTYIFSNSYGHQSHMLRAAKEYPDVKFVAVTGDTAKKDNLPNFSNAFNETYQSRYVSGVVAGMKLAELVKDGKLTDANYDADGNILLGYVGAYPYAEVVSGYTAYYLGVKSVVENVSMLVQYTQSWFDIAAEGEAANALLAKGCVIICQHADSTGAPAAVEASLKAGNVCYSVAPSACEKLLGQGKICYSVGYNVDMLSVAPNAALTSATNNWAVYYEYLFNAVMKGEEVKTNWSEGYATDAVAITALGASCAEGTQEKVESVVKALKDGTLNVFDTDSFTVNGEHLESYKVDLTGDFDTDDEGDKEAIWDGYFHESEHRSAPSFDIRIDGITELSDEQ